MHYFTPVTNHWSLVPTMDIAVFGGENFCEKNIFCLFSWWFLLSTIFLQSPFFTIIRGICLSLFPTTVPMLVWGMIFILLPFFSSYSPRVFFDATASFLPTGSWPWKPLRGSGGGCQPGARFGVVSSWGGISVSYSFPPVKLKESTVIEKFQEISNRTHWTDP